MIRDERRSTIHMAQSNQEYLDQTLFTMTLMNKTYKWILSLIPLRAWVVALLFLCIMTATFTRANVSLAVVTMTVELAPQGDNDTVSTEICPLPEKEFDQWLHFNIPSHPDVDILGLDLSNLSCSIVPPPEESDATVRLRDKVYAWSASVQSNIYGAFFWSYFACLIPAGVFTGKLGGRLIISACLLGSALISFNIPLVTDHVTAFIIMRFILGILHAGLFPAAFAIVCNWIPAEERSVCFALLDVGANVGAILIFVVSGWINHLWGWPALYFFPGLSCFLTFILAVIFIRDVPEQEPDDLEVLDKKLDEKLDKKDQTFDKTKSNTSEEKPSSTLVIPFKGIMTNPRVLACGFFKFAVCWNFIIVGGKIPTYLKVILHQDLSANGYTNACIYFLIAVSLTVTGALSDQIINRGILERTRCRKAFSLVSGFGVAITLLLIPAAGCCPYKLHLFLFLNSICCGFMAGSDASLPSEMSTHFPAVLYSILNMMAVSSGLVAPAFAGFILDTMSDQWSAWCVVFFSSALLLIIATIVFLIFASAERQPFDFIDQEPTKGKETC